jgi:hypothetical protein
MRALLTFAGLPSLQQMPGGGEPPGESLGNSSIRMMSNGHSIRYPTRRNPDSFALTTASTGADPVGWRRWWQAESHRVGSDGHGLIGLHLNLVDCLRRSS